MCAAAFTDEKTTTTQDTNAAQNFFVFQNDWKFSLVLATALHIGGLGWFGFFPYPCKPSKIIFFCFYNGRTWECHPQTLFGTTVFAPECYGLKYRLKSRAHQDRQGHRSERQRNKLDLAEKQKPQFVICLSNKGQR